MVTGDNDKAAKTVAKELGIDKYYANLLPHEKAEIVEKIKKHYKVAFVGDGVNDSIAIAKADVGIAIGSGTDVAIEAADIIIVKNDPFDVIKAIEISVKTYNKMVQNLFLGVLYNIITLPTAIGLLPSISISPSFAAVAMSLSTVIVALNAQLLNNGIISD
jgi:Cu2+-exporting ATPase